MKYTEYQKHIIVWEYHSGKKAIDLCSKYSISKSTLYNWIHKYSEIKADNGEIITAQRLYLLEKTNSSSNN
jgi:transposase